MVASDGRFWQRLATHVVAVGLLWAVAQYPVWVDQRVALAWVSGMVSMAPYMAALMLDNAGSPIFGVRVPYDTWYPIVFFVGYGILVYPIVWQPFRRRWLNWTLPVFVCLASMMLAFVAFIMIFPRAK